MYSVRSSSLHTYILRLMIVVVVGLAGIISVAGQEVVDKTVAVLSDGARTELITYSDLLWQLALQPGAQINSPRSEDLNQALQTLINQRLFALESQRLPRQEPSDDEITRKIAETVSFFPSPAAFQARLQQVGFDSISDDQFRDLISRRLSIEKYVDFRFGSFVVVTPEDEANYYRDVFVPEFRRRTPGLLLPSLEDSRKEIRDTITRQKIATAIETFLDEAKRRVNVQILSEV